MGLSVSAKTIKYLMFAFNFVFVITGMIIIGVGAAVKTIYTQYADFLDTQYFSLPNMLIATGALIFLVSFFGCCGAIKENWILLAIFTFLLCIICLFEFASGIAGYVLRSQTAAYLDTRLRADLSTYNESTHAIWDLIQSNFECCGVDSYADWSQYFGESGELPVSCCPSVSGVVGAFYCNSASTTTGTPSTSYSTTTTTTTQNTTSSETTTSISSSPISARSDQNQLVNLAGSESTTAPYTEGCKSAFGAYIKQHAYQIGGCALGLAILQLAGIGFSFYLVRQLKNGYFST
uniref:Tetraspanin n=1 Tax=Dendroctonus ponderosae TaxID=77166 RepID=A0AAR5PSX6_DENPD